MDIMIDFYPFLFRFGVSFNYSISKEIIKHLYDYFSKKYNILINQTTTDFDCVAIKDKEATNDTSILISKYKKRLKEYNISNYDNSIFFLDLSRVYSDKFTDKLLADILIPNEQLQHKKIPEFILFVDSLDEKSTTLSVLFKIKYSDNNILDRCFIFDKEGQYVNPNLEIKTDNTLPELIKHLSASTLVEKLEFKLVRKINHFKREKDNVWNACQQFFYDGVNCQEEVFQLLKEELLRIADEKKIKPQYIIYDSLYSAEWLSKAIEAVSNTIPSLKQTPFSNYKPENLLDLGNQEDDKNRDDWTDPNQMDIIFISDLINTGSTFKRKINKISRKFPNASISCISALITNKAYSEFHTDPDNENQITITGKKINFFIKVEQIYYNDNSGEKANSCPMCKHNLLPPVEISIDISEKLSSYEMWFMCEEAGYKIEDYQPREGRKNKMVPHSLELFRKNGTLLSVKFEKQLKSSNIYLSDEIVILFPDETQNNEDGMGSPEIEITPSGYFAKRLNLYNDNYTYIPIPRNLIRTIEKGVSLDSIVDTQHRKILSQIRDIEIEKPIVVIDEVNYTGTTFKSITDILNQLDQKPSCYFPLFNFDAKGTSLKYEKELYKNVKFLNLYEFDYV
jgi:orotate phosphoribosyltransferase-like protein